MKIEKMEIVGINVNNLDQAIKLFSDLFGVTFVTHYEEVEKGEISHKKTMTEHANQAFEKTKVRSAIDRNGFFELLESVPSVEKEGMRSIHFKVPDLEQAKLEMKQKGIHLLAEIKLGNLKEAIFSPEDLHGMRLCLIEYDAPTTVDAIHQTCK